MARTAALLIRVVPAVVVIVALPAPRHAAVVLAAELVGLAGAFIWGGTGTGISITHVHKREQACLLAGQAALLAAGQLHQKPPSDPASPTQFRKTNR